MILAWFGLCSVMCTGWWGFSKLRGAHCTVYVRYQPDGINQSVTLGRDWFNPICLLGVGCWVLGVQRNGKGKGKGNTEKPARRREGREGARRKGKGKAGERGSEGIGMVEKCVKGAAVWSGGVSGFVKGVAGWGRRAHRFCEGCGPVRVEGSQVL